MIKMYGIKNCDTIKKARQFLEAQGVDFEFVDFRQTPIDRQTLQKTQHNRNNTLTWRYQHNNTRK
jgi:arsenate reductase-like glutaredoxin family protein